MASDDPYRQKPDDYFSNARREMLPFVPAEAARVLDVGCGRGDFSAALKLARQVHATGIEPFPAAAEVAATRLDALLPVGVDEGFDRLGSSAFDCIVFNDVLEHLVEPGAVLAKAKALLAPTGVVVASIPNIRFFPVLKQLVIHGEWCYAEDGVLDRTHLRFFTMKSVPALFETAGYELVTMEGINAAKLTWKFELLRLLSRGALDDTRHQQIAVVARAR